MKPPTQLRFLSIALFALWGRAGAEALPPFVVPSSLLGPAPTVRPAAGFPSSVKAAAPAAKRTEVPAAPGRSGKGVPAPVKPVKPVKTGSTVITGDKVYGLQDVDAVAEGNAELVRDETRFEGDKLHYFELTDEVEATGNVRMTRRGDTMSGPHARMKVNEQVGTFDAPEYSVNRPGRPAPPGQVLLPGQSVPRAQQPITGHGEAQVLHLEGENQFRLLNGTWTSCKPDRPDWYVRANELELDFDREVGEARGGTLVFKGLPLGYMPWADFPLSDQRRSGVLSPTFGMSNKVGADLTVPYYFNLAPNYDDTLTARYMGTRGLQLRNELRYITPGYKGITSLEYLPNDQIEQRSRYAGLIRHEHIFGGGWAGNVYFGGVSDYRYFSDLSTRLALTSQVNIPRMGTLAYGGGGWWTATGMLQSFQTLQDPKTGARLTEPYKRLPQLLLNANRPEAWGPASFLFAGEYVDFSHPVFTEARRLTAYPQIALPLQTSAFYMTPKLGVHATRYDISYRGGASGDENPTRVLPILSVDSGVTFERDVSFIGKDYTQTLEPRVYYLYVPYQDQSKIPNFDSGLFDFNFAQIFAENIYSGGDRIPNANQITTALQSRLIDPSTGVERIRVGVGQRYYLVDQKVTLPGIAPRTGKEADFLAGFSASFAPKLQLDSAWQYNPRDHWTERFNVGVRYQPAYAKSIGVGWRYRHNYSLDPQYPDGFRDLDISGQWPLWGSWYGVGRYNRNLRDHRLTQGIGGVEYNAGCWVFRGVVQYLTTSTGEASRSFFFQLDFNGVGSLGSSPLDMLRRNVPGYGKINDGSMPLLSNDDEL